tara:strand:+ start:264 stop:464 length:201 start_codon:yes stop_codon:yes gene_type:complete
MGLRDQLKKTKILKTTPPKKLPKDSLDKREITIILNLIKGTTFKGDNIETMYNLILKLQNQYTKLN